MPRDLKQNMAMDEHAYIINQAGEMMDPILGVQIFTLFAVIVGITFELAWLANNNNRSELAGPVISIFIHSIIYYLCLFLTLVFPAIDAWQNRLFPFLFTNWSAILRSHTTVSLAAMSIIRWYYDTKTKCCIGKLSVRSLVLMLQYSFTKGMHK